MTASEPSAGTGRDPAAGLRAVPGAHEGQGRARRGLREAQRYRRSRFASLDGVGSAPGCAGCARWPTCACTAPPASRRSSASSATRRAACARINGRAPFLQMRELVRCVHSDACIELDTNRYSVPWRLIGESVTVVVAERQVRILLCRQEVASHAQSLGRRDARDRSRAPGGHRRAGERACASRTIRAQHRASGSAELLRPLAEYETCIGRVLVMAARKEEPTGGAR